MEGFLMRRAILGVLFFLAAVAVFVASSRVQDPTTFYVYIDLGIAGLIGAGACLAPQLFLLLGSYLAVFAVVLAINNFHILAIVIFGALLLSYVFYSRLAAAIDVA
jgi:hypothetical protein